MPLVEKAVSAITEADLLELVADKQPEAKTLEFKLELPGGSDQAKKEFLYDATSLANTRGGHLIFGMEAKKGLPTNLVGIAGIDPDQQILRLEQILRSGVRPPLNIETTRVNLSNGNVAVVMRIPKSWNPPHQVTFQDAFRFYARDTNGKYQLDVDRLREIFAVSASIADRIRDFRVDRISKIASGDGFAALLPYGALVLHVVPFSAFGPAPAFPIERADPKGFPPIANKEPRRARVTFDGLLMTSNDDAPPAAQRAYVQVLRSGAIEATSSIASGPQRDQIYLPKLEAQIVSYAARYVASLSRLGVEPPIAIFVSFVGVAGKKFLEDTPSSRLFAEDIDSRTLDRAQMHFVESVLTTTMPSNPREVGKLLQGTLDHLANAAGLRRSAMFDSLGEYCGPID